MKSFRQNSDLTHVMLHHAGNSSSSGKDLNRAAVTRSYFGTAYDLVINQNGSLDMGPLWIRALQSTQYLQNAPLQSIHTYPLHHISQASEVTSYNYDTVHVLLMGNFDQQRPKAVQLAQMFDVLVLLVEWLSIRKENVLYHSDVVTTSCPGQLFVPKQEVLSVLQARGAFRITSFVPTWTWKVPTISGVLSGTYGGDVLGV
jgi:hypothetical protein